MSVRHFCLLPSWPRLFADIDWGIENRLHYVRDVSFREDYWRVRHHPGKLARLGSIAHNIIQHNRLPNTAEVLFKNAISFDHLIGLKGL